MTGAEPQVTLAALIGEWGDSYAIGYQQDQWTATRRDGRAVLTRPTLAALDTVINAGYRTAPVPRTSGPPHDSPGGGQDSKSGGPDPDESFLLAALAEAFPAWAISFCHASAVLLCAAMVLAERRYRQSPAG